MATKFKYALWESVDEFFEEEQHYRDGRLNKESYYDICKLYDVEKVSAKWVPAPYMLNTPDCKKFAHEGKPDIRGYFDHFYSFMTKDGELYYVVCPYARGMEAWQVAHAFQQNYISNTVFKKGFYGDYTVVMKASDFYDACMVYAACEDGAHFDAWQHNPCAEFVNPQIIAAFDTEAEAKAFVNGMNCQRAKKITARVL